jgi:hypothetical protein
VTNQLTCIRKANNLKLNINLYKVCILPLYRLSFTYYGKITEKQKNKLIMDIRRTFKKFLCFPRNVSNQLINRLFGSDIDSYIRNSVTPLTNRDEPMYKINDGFHQDHEREIILKDFPKNTVIVIQLMYCNKCFEHQHIINSEHLSRHNFKGILSILSNYQTKNRRKSARNTLNKLQATIIRLKNAESIWFTPHKWTFCHNPRRKTLILYRVYSSSSSSNIAL